MGKLIKSAEVNSRFELIKRMYCKGVTSDEMEIFSHVCQKSGLDPMMKQIYAVKRNGKDGSGSMTIQTSIDGLRLIADRSGNYSPGKESTYCYSEEGALVSATAYLKKRTADGTWHEVSSTAFWNEYRPSKYGDKKDFWDRMPHVMLAKCAEALALRKAFPAEMSGLYTNDEMQQGGDGETLEIGQIEEKPTLSEEQIQAICALANEDRVRRICSNYKVENLEDIGSENFDYIISMLSKKAVG